MGIYKAYCLVQIEKGQKYYVTPELKYWTKDPRKAYFYDSIDEAKSDMQYHIDRNEYSYPYMIENDTNYTKPEYRIEEVEIKVWDKYDKDDWKQSFENNVYNIKNIMDDDLGSPWRKHILDDY